MELSELDGLRALYTSACVLHRSFNWMLTCIIILSENYYIPDIFVNLELMEKCLKNIKNTREIKEYDEPKIK